MTTEAQQQAMQAWVNGGRQAAMLASRPHVSMQLEGGEAIANYLLGVNKALARKLAGGVLKQAAAPMASAMKAAAPRKSGLLARSLRVRMGRNDPAGRYSVVVQANTRRQTFAKYQERAGRKGRAEKVRGAGRPGDKYRVFYGLFVEYGHEKANGSGRVPAHPFARPAFDSHVEQMTSTIENGLTEAVDNPEAT